MEWVMVSLCGMGGQRPLRVLRFAYETPTRGASRTAGNLAGSLSISLSSHHHHDSPFHLTFVIRRLTFSFTPCGWYPPIPSLPIPTHLLIRTSISLNSCCIAFPTAWSLTTALSSFIQIIPPYSPPWINT